GHLHEPHGPPDPCPHGEEPHGLQLVGPTLDRLGTAWSHRVHVRREVACQPLWLVPVFGLGPPTLTDERADPGPDRLGVFHRLSDLLNLPPAHRPPTHACPD